MNIKLSPILTREEMGVGLDDRTMAGIQKASQISLRRGSSLAGEEE